MIKQVSGAEFKRIQYNFNGRSWWYITRYLFKVPPRLKLCHNMLILLNDGTTVIVPRDFVTDGASVPRFIWAIPGFSPFGILLDGGVPHDFAFQHGYLLSIFNPDRAYNTKELELKSLFPSQFRGFVPIFVGKSAKFFDQMFLEIGLMSGAKIIPAVAYAGLRIGGKHVWNKYRKYGPGVITDNALGFPGVDSNGRALL